MPVFITHNQHLSLDLGKTLLMGYIQTTRSRLEKVFGPAQTLYLPKLTTLMWQIDFGEGIIATIYFRGGHCPEFDELASFRIGGLSREAVTNVHSEFRRHHGLSA